MANPMNHPAEYRRRRFMNWFPLGLTYACYYMGRYNLNVSSTTIMDKFHLTKADFGLIATAGFWTYALSVIINGPLADKIGGKKSILIGALGSGILNLVIGLLFLNEWQTKIIIGMSLLYSVSQYFQSFGALSVVKVNAPWFHVKERGVFGGIFGIMISSGYFLALTVGGYIMANLAWYNVFIIPSALLGLMFVIDYVLVRDKQSQVGFADFDTGDATSKDADKDKPVDWGYLMKRVFSNPVILTIIAAEFCTGFVRQGVLLWFVPFLKEVHGITHGMTLFTIATTGITVGGILGGIICGTLSDKVFHSRRPPVAFLFYIGQIIALLLLGWVSKPLFAALLIPFTCMWIFGVHGMLSATSAMDFGGTKAVATVTGVCDGVQYLASGLTGFVLGGMLDKYGWSAWTYMIIPFSIIGGSLMIRLWNETPLKRKTRTEDVATATTTPALEVE
ncbi:MAG: MFS transporter [Deltaproteobacteria bacterium]|nr:MFS transporter [Deltaproteobacteria bacterium]